jgi:hypothetical protein
MSNWEQRRKADCLEMGVWVTGGDVKGWGSGVVEGGQEAGTAEGGNSPLMTRHMPV